MQLGMVGLRRMRANTARRVMRAGHEWVVYDVDADGVAELVADGADDLAALAGPARGAPAPCGSWCRRRSRTGHLERRGTAVGG